MLKQRWKHKIIGQAAIEYMLLLGVVMAIVLVGMKKYLPRTNQAAEAYYNTVLTNGFQLDTKGPLCAIPDENGECNNP